MRHVLPALLIAALVAAPLPSFALTAQKGKIVRGSYSARGTIGVPSLSINYRPTNLKVTTAGKIRGSTTRLVRTKQGNTLQSIRVIIRGNVRSLRERHGSFTASALLRFNDGAVVRGTFHGLSGKGERLSRFFRGKFTGIDNGNFTMRSR